MIIEIMDPCRKTLGKITAWCLFPCHFSSLTGVVSLKTKPFGDRFVTISSLNDGTSIPHTIQDAGTLIPLYVTFSIPFLTNPSIQFAFLGAAVIFILLFIINPREHSSVLTANPAALLNRTNRLRFPAARPNCKTWPPTGSHGTEPPLDLPWCHCGCKTRPRNPKGVLGSVTFEIESARSADTSLTTPGTQCPSFEVKSGIWMNLTSA